MPRGERLRGGRIVVVVAGDLDADRQRLQRRRVERIDAQMTIAARDERVGGPVVAPRRLQQSVLRRDADHDVAAPGIERVADEAAPLRQPEVLERPAAGRARRASAILFSKPSPRCVRERQVVRIGADAQRRLRDRRRSARPPRPSARAPRDLQTEDIDRASRRRVLLDVLHRADHAERGVRDRRRRCPETPPRPSSRRSPSRPRRTACRPARDR